MEAMIVTAEPDSTAIAAPAPSHMAGEFRATAALAGPLILGNLLQTAINTIDVIVLGRYSMEALAASALAVNLFISVSIFGIGLMTAGAPMIAQARGRKLHAVRDIRRTVRQSFRAAVMVCVPIWTILWHAEPLFLMLGQEPGLSHQAAHFLRIAMWGLFPLLICNALRVFVSALERPIWGAMVMAFGVAVNLIVCWTLVFGLFGFPELGLTGAAIANAVANTALALGMIVVVTRVRWFRRYHLFGRLWVNDWARLKGLFAVGVPIAVTWALEVTVFSAAAFLMGIIGGLSLAAHAVALQITSVTFMLPMGLGAAATVRVGLWRGRGDRGGVDRAGRAALTLGMGAAAVSSALMALAPGWMVGLFVDTRAPGGPETFALAVSFLLIASVFQFVDAAQAIGAGMLRGLQDTRWPMIFAATGYWVIGMATAWLFAFHWGMGGRGVWIGLATGLAAVCVMMIGRWMLRDRLKAGNWAW